MLAPPVQIYQRAMEMEMTRELPPILPVLQLVILPATMPFIV